MKLIILILTAVTLLFGNVQTEAKTDETVKVTIGKSTKADRGRIKIQFLSVLEDSRCPRDATCIWSGNARIRIAVSKGSESRIVELNTDLDPRVHRIFGYRVQLSDLNPRNGDPASQNAAAAVISVKKTPR
jgi:hypothetical protein